jgi:hypothetical protein
MNFSGKACEDIQDFHGQLLMTLQIILVLADRELSRFRIFRNLRSLRDLGSVKMPFFVRRVRIVGGMYLFGA